MDKNQVIQNLLSGLENRQGLVDKLKNKLQQMPEQDDQPVNLRPLMSWADTLTGAQTASGYELPKSKSEELKMKLQQQIDKENQGIADDQLKYLQLMDADAQNADKKAYRDAMLRLASRRMEYGGVKEPKLSADAYKAAGFAKRIQQSEDVLNKLMDEGYAYPSRKDELLSFLPNEIQNPKFQEYYQAVSNFVNASLRNESGAAIGKDEYLKAKKQYLPQPGDNPGVLAQKKANREQVFQNLKTEGMGAFEKIPYVNPIGSLGPAKGKKMVTNGNETLEIDEEDLNQAILDGFQEVK